MKLKPKIAWVIMERDNGWCEDEGFFKYYRDAIKQKNWYSKNFPLEFYKVIKVIIKPYDKKKN